MKLGIVVGSIREERAGGPVGQWVFDAAKARGDVDAELIDLKTFNVPLLTSPVVPMAAGGNYDSPEVTAWANALQACDAYIFVTPEYNHGVPGAFKNAIDSIGAEIFGKPVGFVAYGADGGVRAVEQWRQIVGNFQMLDVRPQVSLSLFTDFGDSGFAAQERRTEELSAVLDSVVELTGKLG